MSLGGAKPSSATNYVPANLPTVNQASPASAGNTGFNSTVLTSSMGQMSAPNTAQKVLLGS